MSRCWFVVLKQPLKTAALFLALANWFGLALARGYEVMIMMVVVVSVVRPACWECRILGFVPQVVLGRMTTCARAVVFLAFCVVWPRLRSRDASERNLAHQCINNFCNPFLGDDPCHAPFPMTETTVRSKHVHMSPACIVVTKEVTQPCTAARSVSPPDNQHPKRGPLDGQFSRCRQRQFDVSTRVPSLILHRLLHLRLSATGASG